jgi:outer membrane protein assembly factor BamA
MLLFKRIALQILLAFLLCFTGKGYSTVTSDAWKYRVSAVKITGNTQTREEVILRELTFTTGSMLTLQELDQALEQSRINLINTGLFINHRVTLSREIINRSEVGVLISVEERWYLWPEPILQNADRNFNSWLEAYDFGQLSYGINLIRENFRGRNGRLNIICQEGFDRKYELNWQSPAFGLQSELNWGVGAGMQQNRRLAVTEEDNRLIFFMEDHTLMKKEYGYLQLNVRPALRHFQTFRLMIGNYNLDSLVFANYPSFSPDGAYHFMRVDFSWLVKIDQRNHCSYPLQGYYLDAQFRQQALFSSLPEDAPHASIELNARKYFRLAPRWHYAAGVSVFSSSDQTVPFLFREGLGYGRSFVRGYEYNTIHGPRWFVMKETLKFTLLPERALHLPFMPHQKFRNGAMALYLNLFTDAGYVSAPAAMRSPLSNRWLTSGGLGFDLVTYYDKVLRLEWTVNHRGENGLFVHFVAPI